MNNDFKFCPMCSGKLVISKESHDEHLRQICSSCGFIFYQNPFPAVLAVIEKEDQVLLVKRKNNPGKGYWTLPGGFVEIGQNFESALRSEISEEIGVKIKSFSYFGSYKSEYQNEFLCEDVVCVAFKIEVDSMEFKAGSDVADVKFFPKNNLPKIAPLKDAQLIIKRLIDEGIPK